MSILASIGAVLSALPAPLQLNPNQLLHRPETSAQTVAVPKRRPGTNFNLTASANQQQNNTNAHQSVIIAEVGAGALGPVDEAANIIVVSKLSVEKPNPTIEARNNFFALASVRNAIPIPPPQNVTPDLSLPLPSMDSIMGGGVEDFSIQYRPE